MSVESKYEIYVVSDFNVDVLGNLLNNEEGDVSLEVRNAPFGQVTQQLLKPDPAVEGKQYDAVMIWTRPEAVINSFDEALHFKRPSRQRIISEVETFAENIRNVQTYIPTVFCATWTLPPHLRGYGMLDMEEKIGLRGMVMEMNTKLTQKLSDLSSVYVLEAGRWICAGGSDAFDHKRWYMGKIPYKNQVFKSAARDVRSAVAGLQGQAKKLVVVDLDDTLWGGIVGDVGWENLRVGGHDPLGEAYADFQAGLKALKNRGVLLAIVSKNTEKIALEPFQKNPEMELELDDFAGWRINWQDKALNLKNLVDSFNIGLESVVFIDDNPAERGRIKEALPEVYVPEWPEDKMFSRRFLEELDCFDSPALSNEDAKRAEMYVAEGKRESLKESIPSLEEWLVSLDIKVSVETFNSANRKRTVQLLNKTNQMNLTTRRLTDKQLKDWVEQDNHFLWTFRVSDKFGDSGLTGIASLEVNNEEARVVDFILSCRVMGRKIEEVMLHVLTEAAAQKGAEHITATYLETKKNKPCFDFWYNSGCNVDKTCTVFTWNLETIYPCPQQITPERKDSYASTSLTRGS